jgi:peptide/nickel transport system substrate-binding protein
MRTLLLCLFLVAACGKAEKKAPPFDASKLLPAAPAASPPRRGGTFVWGRSKDSTHLDPAIITEGESVKVVTNLFDTLVTFKPGSTELVPSLAESWETSPDNLVWTFQLRTDVKFHDGTAFDADAVVFSFERQRDPAHPAHVGTFSYFADNFQALAKVEAAGPDRVRFTLARPYAPFLANLALFSASIVCPAAWKSEGVDDKTGRYRYEFARKPVGTGPFVFERWNRDEQIVLRANEGYFAGRPHLDRLVFRPIANNQACLKELEAGTIHGMDHLDPADLAPSSRDPRLRLVSRPGLNVCYLAMHTGKKPFDDARVRRAVAFAIDKRRLIQAAYNGVAQPAVSICPPGLRGHLQRVDRKRNAAEAKALLRDAGYPDGFETTLSYGNAQRAYLPKPGDAAIQIQQDLKEIGIRVKLQLVEWSAFIPMTQRGEHEMCLLGWMADVGDADNFLFVLLDASNARDDGSAQNVSFYRGERVSRLLQRAQASSDDEVRVAAYQEAQEILFDEVPVIPLAHVPDFRLLRKEVRGYTIHPAGGEYFRFVSLAP